MFHVVYCRQRVFDYVQLMSSSKCQLDSSTSASFSLKGDFSWSNIVFCFFRRTERDLCVHLFSVSNTSHYNQIWCFDAWNKYGSMTQSLRTVWESIIVVVKLHDNRSIVCGKNLVSWNCAACRHCPSADFKSGLFFNLHADRYSLRPLHHVYSFVIQLLL